MGKEELTVKNIEDTPLSDGKTLTSLREEYLKYENEVEKDRTDRLMSCCAMGVGALAGLAALAMAAKGIDNTMTNFTAIVASISGVGGFASFWHSVSVDQDYKSYIYMMRELNGKEYYTALKETAIKKGLTEENLEKKSISDLEEMLEIRDETKEEEKGKSI